MRKLILAVMALTAAGPVDLATSAPAAARDYPWCLQGGRIGFPGNCSFVTRAQCMASASGRRATCGVNPRTAFGQQRGHGSHRGGW